jgi:3-oxoacyl-[acyl-carrier-protein] synthase II
MAVSSRRAVITGLGLITPLGFDPDTVWRALTQGRSGIRPIKAINASSLPSRMAGEIEAFDPREFLPKQDRTALKNLRVMARPIQMAVACAQRCLDDGRVDKARLDKPRFGVVFGAGLIATELGDLADAARVSMPDPNGPVNHDLWGEQGLAVIPPLWMLKYLPNMLACQVSILHDAQGHNNSITEGDVSATLALGEAYRILLRDRADFFLVGGAESKLNPLSMTRQCLFEQLSTRNDAPEKACRPFDRRRDGLVLGEGAGVMVVEDLEHAQRRGARIYAEIVGFGAAFDHRQDGGGVARAIRSALNEAGIGPDRPRQRPGPVHPNLGRLGGAGLAGSLRPLFAAGAGLCPQELHRQPRRRGRRHRAGVQHPGLAARPGAGHPELRGTRPGVPRPRPDQRPAREPAVCAEGQLYPAGPVWGGGGAAVVSGEW